MDKTLVKKIIEKPRIRPYRKKDKAKLSKITFYFEDD